MVACTLVGAAAVRRRRRLVSAAVQGQGHSLTGSAAELSTAAARESLGKSPSFLCPPNILASVHES